MMAAHLTDLARTVLRRGRHPSQPDPFETLGIQLRLARLTAEIRRLEQNDGRWARVHHLRAAQAAYDDVLAEACRLLAIPLQDAVAPVRRLLAETELRSRGWSW
ncbi:MAG TPA: hypothetical protein VFR13_01475 [Jiangellaceae bacterium]|nr:hypothetical protein [Jiangellaceae bacterium]HJU97651.1 hypothetical protein [Jiangellaceae bacterium]